MTNYPGENEPRGGGPYQSQQPANEPYDQGTAQFPPQGAPPGGGQGWEQPRQGRYMGSGYRDRRDRPHLHVRSTFLTTEFWVFVLVAIGILIAAAVTDEGADGQGFGANDAWKYITWLAIGYVLSRGLTKLGGNRRDGGDPGNRV